MKKVGYFFFSFLPFLATEAIQICIMIPLMGFSLIALCLSANDKISYMEFSNQLLALVENMDFLSLVSLTYAICNVIVFCIWYQKQFHGNFTKDVKRFVHPGLFAAIICLVPMLQVITGFITTGVAAIFPSWMEAYEKLMETSGLMGDTSFMMMLYAVIVGPVSEELIFRGVTLSSIKRVLPFWAANLFQAVLFGIFHMNMIQGIYAFFIGVVFGYICEKTGCIWYVVILHMLFNLWGTAMPALGLESTSPAILAIIYAGIFIVGIVGIVLWVRLLPRQKQMREI